VGGVPQDYQLTVRRKDGSILELHVTQVPITSGDEVVGVHGTAKDITETRKAEEELKRSEERYRLVTLATKEAIWDNDLLTGEQRWVGATEALFGYPPHEGRTGTWWEERIHPDDRGKVLSGLAALLAEGGETWAEQYRFRRADGSYAHVADRGYAVHDETTCRVVRMVGSMTDITDRREPETRLRKPKPVTATAPKAWAGAAYHRPRGYRPLRQFAYGRALWLRRRGDAWQGRLRTAFAPRAVGRSAAP
jgi:PAS domain S-box-containing protein